MRTIPFVPADATTAAITDPGRLAELRATGLLDSPPEAPFDRITRLAERLLDVPVAMITLIDRDRQFIKSQVGLSGEAATTRQQPLTHSFCQYAVASGSPLVIDDARESPLVRTNPSVREHDVIAYAGQPLTTSKGHVLGALCVIAPEPRLWQPADLGLLGELSALAATEIEYRLRVRTLQDVEQRTVVLQQSVSQLGESVHSMAAAAERAGDPLVGRLASLARNRLASVTAAADDLNRTVASTQMSAPVLAAPLGDRVMRAVKIATASVPDKDITIEMRDQPLTVACDPPALEQGLGNMLVSAMHQADQDRPVDVSVARDGDSARLRIRSDGSPMPVSELARTVSQLNEAASVDEEGAVAQGDAFLQTNAGVTTVQNGAVEATTSDTGTKVTVVFPIVEPDDQASSSPTDPNATPNSVIVP